MYPPQYLPPPYNLLNTYWTNKNVVMKLQETSTLTIDLELSLGPNSHDVYRNSPYTNRKLNFFNTLT